MFSLLLGVPAFAEGELPEAENAEELTAETPSDMMTESEQTDSSDVIVEDETICIESIEGTDDGDISLMSTFTDPEQAFLKVNTNCYAAPCATDGYLLQTLPANTTVWVVERKYCSHLGRYYYYAGYNYNGESHRGYFCEDNVYLTSSTRLLPTNVSAESSPANYKVHTSKAGTVYDGPADTYSTMGSVGAESVKLIRTDGNYNFIEYTVTGTNKVKRGHLYYSNITDVWSNLTSQVGSKLNGKTFYLKNTATGKYMQAATAEVIQDNRMVQKEFTGETHQIFKFVYYGSRTQKYFRIIPANCYSETAPFWLTTQSIASHPHPDRKAMIYPDRPNKTYQRYWVVKREGTTDCYKIVPVSSYGTMTLTNRPSGSTYNVNQYYTNTETDDVAADIWRFVSTTQSTGVTPCIQPTSVTCWAAAAKMAASSTSSYGNSITIESALTAMGATLENAGNPTQTALLTNYFHCGEFYCGSYVSKDFYKYTEANVRKFLINDYAIIFGMANNDVTHMIVVYKFQWVDVEQKYIYYYYNPYSDTIGRSVSFDLFSNLQLSNLSLDPLYWRSSVVYDTTFSDDAIYYTQSA